MQIQSLFICKNGKLNQGITLKASALPLFEQSTVQRVWHDIEGGESHEWLAFMDNPLSADLVAEQRHFPEAQSFPGGLFIHVPLRTAWSQENSVYLTVLLMENTLFTLHSEALPLFSKVRAQLEREAQNNSADAQNEKNSPLLTLSDVLLTCFEQIMEAEISSYLELRAIIEEQADTMTETPKNIPAATAAASIATLKHAVGHLSSQCEDQFYCFTVLRRQLSHAEYFFDMRNGVNDMLDDLGHLQRSLQRLGSRLNDMQSQLDGLTRSQTELRLRLLSLFSAIFMPMSLIAGIYGMNFQHMPELENPWGYPLALTSMVGLGVGMALILRWRGWFR